MTRQKWADWADKKVHAEQCRASETVYDFEARLLRNEHKRAVRVVKAEIKRVKLDQHSYKGYEKTIALALLDKLLAALQKGRT